MGSVDIEDSSSAETANLSKSSKSTCITLIRYNRRYQLLVILAIAVAVAVAVTVPLVVLLRRDQHSDDDDQSVVANDDYYNVCLEDNCVYCIGRCNEDIVTTTQSGAVLMGGGTDTDAAFEWQIKNANGGDFLVLRATGSEGYNQYVYDLAITSGHPLNSVTSIVMTNRSASYNQTVLDLIRGAEAIFFAGGDQSLYLEYWVGTDVQSIVQSKVNSITIGGTSAGCAILGNWIFGANLGTVTSPEALCNPYDPKVDIVDAFLKIPFMESIITDTHFVTRNRMGRMNTFQARLLKDVGVPHPRVSRAVGTDEHTALLLNTTTGDVRIVGVGTAYICDSFDNATICEPNQRLTFLNVSCQRLSALDNNTYSFRSWFGDGVSYVSNITDGRYQNSPYGSSDIVSSNTYDDDTVVVETCN